MLPLVVKKVKGCISTHDKVQTRNCFVVAVTTEKTERDLTIKHLSVHQENGKFVYFTENSFQKRLSLFSKFRVIYI